MHIERHLSVSLRYTINSKTDLDFHPTFTIAPDESSKKFIAISYPGEFVFFLFLQAIDRVIPANIQSLQEASLLYSFDSGQGNNHLRGSRYQRGKKKGVVSQCQQAGGRSVLSRICYRRKKLFSTFLTQYYTIALTV